MIPCVMSVFAADTQLGPAALRVAVVVTIVGLIGSSLVITMDRPVKLHGDGKSVATAESAPAFADTGAGSVSAAASYS